MEQIKVKKRDTIIYNIAIFLMLSFFFTYIQHAYRFHLAPFSLVYLQKSIELFWYLALPVVLTSFLVWRHHRFSPLMFQLCVFLVCFKVIEGLFFEFNKIIVITLFFYVVIAYFLFQYLTSYLSLARINPNYSENDLFKPILKEISCELEFNNQKYNGILTNWDEDGCFVLLDESLNVLSAVTVSLVFFGRHFTERGEVVASTLDYRGFGIKFETTKKEMTEFNWSEFMELIEELGFQPERLR